MMSPGSALLRLLSSRAAPASSVPIWSCQRNDSVTPRSRMGLLALTAHAKPTSLSPLLGLRFCGTTGSSSTDLIKDVKQGVSVEIKQGLPHLTVPLPSRNELVSFVLKPVTHTIGDLIAMLKTEDHGIDRVVIRNTSGVRIASTTSIQTLMQSDFDLIINDISHRVEPPPFHPTTALTALGDDELKRIGDVRAIVGQLYEALHVEEYQAQQEQRLVRELEAMKDELEPLEESKKLLAVQAEKRATHLTWVGLGLMSVQFGILARLTWWEYSWDIMEPVTYFVTYGTAMACYAYFVLTKEDYLLPDVRDRQYLLNFHKRAKKSRWDVDKYNSLKEGITRVEMELLKLRDDTKLRPSQEALRKAAEELDKGSGILGAQVNIGSIRDLFKGKFPV